MEVFPHGDHVVLDGTEEELARVAAVLDGGDAEPVRGAAGRIERGLDAGATRIAVAAEGARAAVPLLAADPSTAAVADRVAEALDAIDEADDEEDGA